MKLVAARLVDSSLLFCLIYGHFHGIESAEIFAVIVIGSMVAVAALGCFTMTEDLAKALTNKSLIFRYFTYLVCAIYTAAMVATDHPQWAAAYFIVFSWLFASAHSKLNDARAKGEL